MTAWDWFSNWMKFSVFQKNSLSDKCQILSLMMNNHQMLSDRHSMDQKNPLFRKKPNILYEMTYRICAFHVKLEIFSHLQFPTVYGMWPYTNFTTNYYNMYYTTGCNLHLHSLILFPKIEQC